MLLERSSGGGVSRAFHQVRELIRVVHVVEQELLSVAPVDRVGITVT